MKLLLLFIIILLSPAYAEIALDSKYLETILKQHPKDIETRLLLASYYLNIGDLFNSEQLINSALTQESANKVALNLHNKWLAAKTQKELLQKLGLVNFDDKKTVNSIIKQLYKKQEFDSLNQLFDLLIEKKLSLNKENQINYVLMLVEQNKYEQALEVIGLIENQSTKVIQTLLAKICYALNNWECAARPLNTLFYSSHNLEIGLQLAEVLIQQGKISDAKKISAIINKKNSNNPKAIGLSKKITALFKTRISTAKKDFQDSPSTTSIKKLSNYLFSSGDNNQAYSKLNLFIKEYPENDEIKLFTAKKLASEKLLYSAIKILKSLRKPTTEAHLLLAKYYSRTGKRSKEAKTTLKNILSQDRQKNAPAYPESITNEATILLGKLYILEGNNSKTQEILSPFIKKHPSNQVAKELYLLAKSKYNPLTEQYGEKSQKPPINAQIYLRLANLYQTTKNNDKALQYYERYLDIQHSDPKVENTMGQLYLSQKKYNLGFKLLKRHAYRQHTEESLLTLANHYHWNGFNEDALEVIVKLQAYYPKSNNAARLKEKLLEAAPLTRQNQNLASANKKYQEGNYKAATKLYKKYLSQYPNDDHTRHKYAYSLGQIGSYTNAANEFATIAQAKPNAFSSQYYYAYNLERSENYQQAKKAYRNIVEKIAALPLNKQKTNAKFYKHASFRLKVIEKNKDTVVNGVYLGAGIKKDLSPESKVLSSAFVSPIQLNPSNVPSSFVAEDILNYSPLNTKKIGIDYQHSSDRTGVNYNSPVIKAQYNAWPYEINFAGGGFTFEDEMCGGKYGGTIEFSGLYKKSSSSQYGGGLRIDEFDSRTEFSPFINSRLKFDQNNIDIQLYKRPLFYEKLSCKALKNHLNKYGIQISGNMEFSKKQALWYSVDAGYIDDSNIEVNPQFNLVVYRSYFKNSYIPIDYEFAIEGYYLWNKKQKEDYYSPEVFDATSISFTPTFQLGNDFIVTPSAAIGYSVDVDSLIFRYGLSAEFAINKELKAKAGCERSNVGHANAGGENYHSNDCMATLEYEWQ